MMLFSKKQIKVSVILPVYNEELYIEQCLDKLVNQTLHDIEIICIDDGSTDNSYSLIKKYTRKDKRVRLIRQENKGAGSARNIGLDIAKGEYLFFPDSDDIPDINLLEKTYYEAKKTDADVVAFKSNRLDAKTNDCEPCTFSLYIENLPSKRPFCISDVEGNFFRFFMGWAWDKLFKNEYIKESQLRFQEQRSSNDMYFVYMSLVLANRISCINESLYTQRINIASSLSMTRGESWDGFYQALNEIRIHLCKLNLWDLYERVYVDYALHSCIHNMEFFPKKQRLYLLNQYFSSLGIISARRDWFTSEEEYEIYISLKNEIKRSGITI